MNLLGRSGQQLAGRLRFQLEPFRALFEARQIKEIIYLRQETLGVLAGVEKQLKLFRREGADRFLKKQVDRKPDTGERRLQLVAYRGDQIALDLVEQAKAGDVLEQDRRTERVAKGIANWQDLRQQAMLLVFRTERDRLVEGLRQVGLLFDERFGQRLA